MQVAVEPSNVKPFVSKLVGCRLGKVTEIDNPPDKRISALNGKQYTPPSFLLQFEDGSLFFIMEDIKNTRNKMSGVCIEYKGYTVLFTETEQKA